MPKQSTTPGPYGIRKGHGGYQITGVHGVALAWVAENGTYGVNGSHTITPEECKANAELFLSALQNREVVTPVITNSQKDDQNG